MKFPRGVCFILGLGVFLLVSGTTVQAAGASAVSAADSQARLPASPLGSGSAALSPDGEMDNSSPEGFPGKASPLPEVLGVARYEPSAPRPAFRVDRYSSLERLFTRTSGWIGGDGAFTVPLGRDRLLWLFSDSFIGRVYAGRRANATMINNAVAIQHGLEARRASVRFHLGKTAAGGPRSFFVPPDGKGWFWIFHGVRLPAGLFLTMMQIERTEDTSAFGFRHIDTWLVKVPNPDDPPENWRQIWRKVPWRIFGDQRNLFFGSSYLLWDGRLYLHGIDEIIAGKTNEKRMVVARVAPENLDRFDFWEFWDGRVWVRDFRRVAPLAGNFANEYSVVPMGEGKGLRAVYSEPGLSPRLLCRTAPRPEGPWSEPQVIWTTPPHPRQRQNVFFYAGKEHPELATHPGEMVITWVANSFDFLTLLMDASLYWPRFLRVQTVTPESRP